jgi:hypothetical protein
VDRWVPFPRPTSPFVAYRLYLPLLDSDFSLFQFEFPTFLTVSRFFVHSRNAFLQRDSSRPGEIVAKKARWAKVKKASNASRTATANTKRLTKASARKTLVPARRLVLC